MLFFSLTFPWMGWFRNYWFWDGLQFFFAFNFKVFGHGRAKTFWKISPVCLPGQSIAYDRSWRPILLTCHTNFYGTLNKPKSLPWTQTNGHDIEDEPLMAFWPSFRWRVTFLTILNPAQQNFGSGPDMARRTPFVVVWNIVLAICHWKEKKGRDLESWGPLYPSHIMNNELNINLLGVAA
jgi:hypothetical protein